MHIPTYVKKSLSCLVLIAILFSLPEISFALTTQLNTARLESLADSNGLVVGYHYLDTDLNIFKKATATNTLEALSAPSGSIVTTSELAALKTTSQIIPQKAYWNSETQEYEQGESTTNTHAIDTSNRKKATTALELIHTNKTATTKVNYWDILLKIFSTGQSDGSLKTFGNNNTKEITLTFSDTPTNFSISPAELKYNKDFASSFTFDDGYGSVYRNMFKMMNGGYIEIDDTTYPGLFFTDGAGNDINFTAGMSWFDLQSPDLTEMHNESADYWMKPSEMQEMLDNGWDIYHHGLTSAAFRDTRISDGDPLIQYPSPPGPDALNYEYEVSQGSLAIQNRFGVTPKVFISPSGDVAYRQPAYDAGFRMLSAKAGTHSLEGESITVDESGLRVEDIDTDKPVLMYRQYYHDGIFNTSNNLDYSDATAALSGANDHYWISEFTHQVKDEIIGGSVTYSTMKDYLQSMESTYGKSGSDNVWFAGIQEVYEYQIVKDNVEISTTQNGNTVIVTIDTSNLPDDLRDQALSLNITADKSLTNVDYGTEDFVRHSHNLNTKLINLDWSSRWESLADKYIAIAEASLLAKDVQTAQDFIDKFSDTSIKSVYQEKVNAIVINTDKTFYIDIGNNLSGYDTSDNWNNLMPTQLSETNLVNSNGSVSTIDVVATGYYDTDSGVTESNSILYPYSAMRDSFEVNPTNPLTLTFNELDNAKKYSFKIFAGRQNGNSSITDFTIGGVTKSIQAKDNIANDTVEIPYLSPTSGSITLTVSTTESWGFINTIELTETDPSGATCFDNIKNQDETDTDCGGSSCSGCDLNETCSGDSDCSSSNCSEGICAITPTCSDGIINQDETDTDCGGSVCSGCELTEACSSHSDCNSGGCSAGVCTIITGKTFYIDLGNNLSGHYSVGNWNNLMPDELNKTSLIDSDGIASSIDLIATGFYETDAGLTEANSILYPYTAMRDSFEIRPASPLTLAFNDLDNAKKYSFKIFAGRQNGDSSITDFNIGGVTESIQAKDNIANNTVDFPYISPTSGTITLTVSTTESWGFINTIELTEIDISGTTCSDGILNQDETDIDCGGSSCDACAISESCSDNEDCNSANCSGGICAIAETCSDGILNQDETEIDCGGIICNACVASPTCFDGIMNQDESAIDCGGTTCEACAEATNKWQISLGENSNTYGAWNTINIYALDSRVDNLYTSLDEASDLDIHITQQFSNKKIEGVLTGDDSGIVPDSAIERSLWMYGNNQLAGKLQIEGLSPSKTYKVSLVGSTTKTNNDLYTTTEYIIGGVSKLLQTTNNTQSAAVFENLSPNALGEIEITVRSAEPTGWAFASLNALVIEDIE